MELENGNLNWYQIKKLGLMWINWIILDEMHSI